jgi:hypothetical protein
MNVSVIADVADCSATGVFYVIVSIFRRKVRFSFPRQNIKCKLCYMKHQGDSSFLKSLAVAFGDGLAFGVGVKIAQSSARKRAEIAPVELPPAPVVISVAPAPPAEAAESLDLQLLSKVIASIDAKLAQHLGKVEGRLAHSESQMTADLKALDNRQAQQNSNSQGALEEIHATLTERVALAERAAQSVESRVAGFIEAAVEAAIQTRVQTLEQRLHHDIAEAGDRTAKLLVQTIETKMLARIELLEGEVRGQAATIRVLREDADGSKQKLHGMLEGIGRVCQEAVNDLNKAPQTPAADALGPAQAAEEDHRFDSLKLVNYEARSERKLPIPLVSSIAVFVLSLAAWGSSASWF